MLHGYSYPGLMVSPSTYPRWQPTIPSGFQILTEEKMDCEPWQMSAWPFQRSHLLGTARSSAFKNIKKGDQKPINHSYPETLEKHLMPIKNNLSDRWPYPLATNYKDSKDKKIPPPSLRNRNLTIKAHLNLNLSLRCWAYMVRTSWTLSTWSPESPGDCQSQG